MQRSIHKNCISTGSTLLCLVVTQAIWSKPCRDTATSFISYALQLVFLAASLLETQDYIPFSSVKFRSTFLYYISLTTVPHTQAFNPSFSLISPLSSICPGLCMLTYHGWCSLTIPSIIPSCSLMLITTQPTDLCSNQCSRR